MAICRYLGVALENKVSCARGPVCRDESHNVSYEACTVAYARNTPHHVDGAVMVN